MGETEVPQVKSAVLRIRRAEATPGGSVHPVKVPTIYLRADFLFSVGVTLPLRFLATKTIGRGEQVSATGS